jgi:hypothetical protein
MKGSKVLFLASWVILLVLCAALVAASVASLSNALFSQQDVLTHGVTLDQIRAAGGDEAVKAFKGRRVSAATWALACGLLAMWVVITPYRRGERWAWWALLISLGLAQLLSLARVPVLGTTSGAAAAGMVLAFLLLGLLAGVPRMFRREVDLPDIQ